METRSKTLQQRQAIQSHWENYRYTHRDNKTEIKTRSKTLQRRQAIQSHWENYNKTNVFVSPVSFTVKEYIANNNTSTTTPSTTTPSTTPSLSSTPTQSTIASVNRHNYRLRRRIQTPNYVEDDFVYVLDTKDEDYTPYVHHRPNPSIVDTNTPPLSGGDNTNTPVNNNNLALSSISPTHISSFIRRFHSSMMERDNERDIRLSACIPTHRMVLRSAGF